MSHTHAGTSCKNIVLFIIGLVFCIIFSLLLLFNLSIIIQSTLHPQEPPSIGQSIPLVVMSGSMSGDANGHIEAGDLIFVQKTEPTAIQVNDVITFREANSPAIVTHRVIQVQKDDSSVIWTTKGDANPIQDENPVRPEQLIGSYQFRIPKLGNFALFLKQPLGMLLFVAVPLLAFIIYDILRRQKQYIREAKKASELEAELDKIRRNHSNP